MGSLLDSTPEVSSGRRPGGISGSPRFRLAQSSFDCSSAPRACSSATTVGSARVVVSPSGRFSATSRSSRRMILPLRVFGSSGVKTMFAGFAIGPIFFGDVVAQLVELRDRRLDAALQRDEGDDRLAGRRVVARRDGSLGDVVVVDERRLDLDRRDAMAGDVHHVVDAAEQPEVAVLVDARAVAGEVDVAVARPVRVDVAVVLLVEAAQHRGPRLAQHEVAAAARADLLAGLVVDRRIDAGERPRRRARLRRRDPRKRRDHDHPRLRLPPRVDDRAALAADVLVVPDPRLRVDRLARPTRAAAASRGRASPRAPAPTSCASGSRSARCRGSSRRSARRSPTSGPCRGSPACLRTSPTWRRCRAARRRCSCDRSPSRRRPRTSRRRCRASGRRCSGASSRRRRDSRRSCARSPSASRSCPTCRAGRADPRDPSAPPGTVTPSTASSCHQWSRPSVIGTSLPVRRRTTRSARSARRRPPRRRCASAAPSCRGATPRPA